MLWLFVEHFVSERWGLTQLRKSSTCPHRQFCRRLLISKHNSLMRRWSVAYPGHRTSQPRRLYYFTAALLIPQQSDSCPTLSPSPPSPPQSGIEEKREGLAWNCNCLSSPSFLGDKDKWRLEVSK